MAIKQQILKEKTWKYDSRVDESKYKRSGQTKKTAFLCHSHQDEALVKGLIVLLREQGIELYIDWLDHSMPEKPNKETASKIQRKIKDSNLFLFLATENSKASRWCPWEIGYADACPKNIYIIPTSAGYETYGNEYLDLYKRIDVASNNSIGKSGFGIFDSSDSGVWLTDSTLR